MNDLDTNDSTAFCKPRLALMGEFSAGKSTLSNLLLEGTPLPTRVTATRLPPVWISYGAPGAVQVAHDGRESEFSPDDIDDVDLDHTRLIRLQMEADFLQICDLIDMPGISDPNMDAEVWQSVFGEVDSVVWCTHATQAWRQSEAATWDEIRDLTNGDNLLLVSQIDKLASERDRARVLARIERETRGLFKGIYPVSLLDALQAGEDGEKWNASGASDFIDKLVEFLVNPAWLRPAEASGTPDGEPAAEVGEEIAAVIERDVIERDMADPEGHVTPKRVKAKSKAARPRPAAKPKRAFA